jgi:glycerol-3-phosphate dehydrogenase
VPHYDILVIGGGIIGCGIARDAALRGLRVALVEREDYGYGTSSRSTRLIHGGLRYLEMFDFGLVRQDLREREILLKIAPHRVEPLPFLLPYYHRPLWYRWKMAIGMVLYDLLSFDKTLPPHRILSRKETLEAEPNLNPNGLQGAALYYDAQVNLPERLCMDNILDAQENGAETWNHTEVLGLERSAEGKVVGVQVQNRLTAKKQTLTAKVVLNVTGAWRDRATSKWSANSPLRLRLTKGIHFTSPSANKNALVLFSPKDGRLMFVIPWLGYAWVGTTDTDFNSDLDTVHATPEEVAYLQEAARHALPQADWETVYFTNAGVRALVRENRPEASESAVSRKHGLVVHTKEEGLEGLVSVLGGKLTAYRDIAQEAVETALSLLSSQNEEPSTTHLLPLPGAENRDSLASLHAWAQELGLEEDQIANLFLLYGTRTRHLLSLVEETPMLGERIAPAYPDIYAEICYAVEREQAQTLSDFMLRRTRLGFTPDQGLQALEATTAHLALLLKWDTERAKVEGEAYRAQIALTQAFRTS